MICPKCHLVIPDDSDFCQFCGADLAALKEVEAATKEPVKNDSLSQDNNISAVEERESNSAGQSAPAKNRKIVGILLALSLLGNAFLGYQWYATSSQIHGLSREATRYKNTVTNRNKEIDELSNNYDQLVEALSNKNLGYASSDFCVDEKIVVVERHQTDKKVKLTSQWTKEEKIDISYSQPDNPAAEVKIDEKKWTTSTTLSVDPKHRGVTTVTLSNVNGETFDVVIVVK